jgi:hypothetical protein
MGLARENGIGNRKKRRGEPMMGEMGVLAGVMLATCVKQIRMFPIWLLARPP